MINEDVQERITKTIISSDLDCSQWSIETCRELAKDICVTLQKDFCINKHLWQHTGQGGSMGQKMRCAYCHEERYFPW